MSEYCIIVINDITIYYSKVAKLRASIALEPVCYLNLYACYLNNYCNFFPFEKVSQTTVKECILSSTTTSCDVDPIPSTLLMECPDNIFPSLTDLSNFSLHLTSSHNASYQLLSDLQ